MATPEKYRMDKTAFKIQTFEEADDAMRDYLSHSIQERLGIAYYLTSLAYRFDMEHPPRMDKTIFSIKKPQRLMNIFQEDFRDFIKALNDQEVKYVMVDGMAVIFHGHARVTGDMD